MAWYRCSAAASAEIHGAKIVVICGDAGAIGQTVTLKKSNSETVGTQIMSESTTVLFDKLLEPDIYTAFINIGGVEYSNSVQVTASDIVETQLVECTIETRFYLYNDGDECTDYTDGWVTIRTGAETTKGTNYLGVNTGYNYDIGWTIRRQLTVDDIMEYNYIGFEYEAVPIGTTKTRTVVVGFSAEYGGGGFVIGNPTVAIGTVASNSSQYNAIYQNKAPLNVIKGALRDPYYANNKYFGFCVKNGGINFKIKKIWFE